MIEKGTNPVDIQSSRDPVLEDKSSYLAFFPVPDHHSIRQSVSLSQPWLKKT